jgi:hypothetical protein
VNTVDKAQLIGTLIFTLVSFFGSLMLMGLVSMWVWIPLLSVSLFSMTFFGYHTWLIIKDAYFSNPVPDFRGEMSPEDKERLAQMEYAEAERTYQPIDEQKGNGKKIKSPDYKKTKKRLRKLQKEGRISNRNK